MSDFSSWSNEALEKEMEGLRRNIALFQAEASNGQYRLQDNARAWDIRLRAMEVERYNRQSRRNI